MNETEAESLSAHPGVPQAAMELGPLAAGSLPPAVQKLLTAPPAMKTMAARGIAPLRPAELLTAIYQLSFDGEEGVRTATQAAPGSLPDKVLAPALADLLPAQVLHFFAARIAPDRIAVIEPIFYNRATADQTFVLLASRLRDRELEVMFQNESRILRCPAILEALYFNPQARMSSSTAPSSSARATVCGSEGIPCFDEVAKSIAQDVGAKDPAIADAGFATLLDVAEKAALVALDDPHEKGENGSPAAGAPATEEKTEEPGEAPDKRQSPVIDFTQLKLYEKIRLATLGNEYCRKNLLRDPNRMVAMAAIRSPRITDSEIVNAAANRSVCEDVIRYIGDPARPDQDLSGQAQPRAEPQMPAGPLLEVLALSARGRSQARRPF